MSLFSAFRYSCHCFELDAHRREKGQRQHSQGDVPVPAVAGADLVIGQADLLLGDLEAFLDRPAPSGDAGESGQAGVRWTEDDVIGELVRLARMAADEQPVIPGRLLQAHQAYPRPIVEPLAFGTGARREALPLFCRYSCRQRRGGVLAHPVIEHRPQLLVTADGEHERALLLLEIDPQAAIGAIDLVAQNPGERYVGGNRPGDHAARQLGLGGEPHLLANAGRLTPGAVLGPLLRKVQLAVDQRMPVAAGISQEHADLAVLDAPRRAAVLARHAGRLRPLLQKASLVDDQYRLPIGQGLDHVPSTQVARRRLGPLHVREHPLRAPWSGVAEMLGQLPAILAFHRTQQALKIETGLPPRLGADEQLAQASLQPTQLRPPLKNTGYTHAPSRCDPTQILAI